MSSFPNPIFLHEQFIISNAHNSRRLLLHPIPTTSSPSPLPPLQPKDLDNTFDANVVMVLSVLLCALICSLGLNSIIRCALRCSTFIVTDPSDPSGAGAPPSARLANTGIKKKALKKFLVINYADDLKLPGLDTECAICLSDFAPGERVRVLPKCTHGFHVRCIDRWLNSHSSCPTCRHCLIDTCNKIIGCSTSQAPASVLAIVPSPPPPPQVHQQEVVIRIEPLQPEGLIRNHEI